MAQITPIYDIVNTQENDTVDGNSTNCSIAGASLANGVDYLIIYCAGFGGNGTSDEVGVRVEFGATVVARAEDEGSSSGSIESQRVHQLSGCFIITGTGSDALTIKYQIHSGTCYVSGMALIAIPLADLTENTDYFQTMHNSDTAEATSTGSWTTVRSLTKTFPNSTYLVIASMETAMPSGGASGGPGARFQIDTVTQKGESTKEWETNNDSINHFYCRLHTLNGSQTLRWQVGVGQGTDSVEARRSRIIAINTAFFDQIVSSIDDTGQTCATDLPSYETYISKAYTPNQTEYVIVLANCIASAGTNYRSINMRIANTSDSTYFGQLNGDDPKDIAVQDLLMGAVGCEQISAAKTYALQIADEESSATGGFYNYADIIIWSMELAFAITYKLEGVTKDKDGNTKGTCECFLCKDNGDNTCTYVAYTQSDGDGNYSFTGLNNDDAAYFVISWKDDTPHVFDVTDHILQPVEE